MLSVCALVLAACASPASLGRGTTPTSATGSSPCREFGRDIGVTQHDGGKTFALSRCTTVTLSLGGSSLDWSAPVLSGSDVLHVVEPYRVRSGHGRARYVTIRTGRETLQAIGRPKCEAGKACPQFELLFTVEFDAS